MNADEHAPRLGWQWLSELMRDSPDPATVLDSDDHVEWANAASLDLARRLGITPAGAIPWEAVPALRDEGLPDLVARARHTPGTPTSARIRMKPATGNVWYLVRAVETAGWVVLQWLDVTEQTEAEYAAIDRSRGLQALNAALIQASGTDGIVAAIVEHALPLLGATGLVMHDLTGPEPRLLGLAGHSPDFAHALEAMDWHRRLAGAAQNSGQPLLVGSAEALTEGWPHLQPLAYASGKQAWAVIPLTVAGDPLGVAVFAWDTPRQFTADDRSLLGTIGVVAAHALRTAHTLRQARQRADRLEKELAPGPPPDLPGIRAAVRYRATGGAGPGGHWYDVVPLSGGRALLVAGEVTAGPDDAVAMGILRQQVLTMAALDMPLDDVLAHAGDAALRLGHRLGGAAVTARCLLAVVDPTSGRCTIASAGHTPPTVIRPGHTPSVLRVPVGDPLGIARVPAQATNRDDLSGTVLVLANGAAPGGTSLADAIAHHSDRVPLPAAGADSPWLESLCDTIIEDRASEHGDLVLLAAYIGRLPDDHIGAWELPRVPESAAAARGHVDEILNAWHLPELADTMELLASELVGNCVRHASGIGTDAADPTPGHVWLRMLHLADHVVCEVYDGSASAPRVRHPRLTDEYGRGLQLVALSTDSWGTRYTRLGKCVWGAVDAPNAEAAKDHRQTTADSAQRPAEHGPGDDPEGGGDTPGEGPPRPRPRPTPRRAAQRISAPHNATRRPSLSPRVRTGGGSGPTTRRNG